MERWSTFNKYENLKCRENSNFLTSIEPDGLISWWTNATNSAFVGNIIENEWNFIALVFEGGNLSKSYINDTFHGSHDLNLSTAISRTLILGQDS